MSNTDFDYKGRKGVDLNLEFNNTGLKSMFPGTIVTVDSLKLGDLNADYLAASIKSVKEFQYDYERFEIDDMDLEGEYDKWILNIKLNVM